MPKDEWGVKRLCPTCGTRFYDLQRDPMTCPSCGAVFTVESLQAKKSGSRAEKKEAAPAPAAAAKPTTDDTVLDDDTDADADVGDDVLDDDDDDTVNLDEIADVASDEEDT